MRTVRIKKIQNGYVTTTKDRNATYENYCPDFSGLCLWLKNSLEPSEEHETKTTQKYTEGKHE
tara:strand:+ start:304 stop:492 length:189 start_codon:yes stop_codon:yes gene_type:complete